MPKVDLTRVELRELIFALNTREDWVKAHSQDPIHGVVLQAAELSTIDEVRQKLEKARLAR